MRETQVHLPPPPFAGSLAGVRGEPVAPRAGHLIQPQPSLRSEEHTSELQSQSNLVCRLLLEKKKKVTHPANHCLVDDHMRIPQPRAHHHYFITLRIRGPRCYDSAHHGQLDDLDCAETPSTP